MTLAYAITGATPGQAQAARLTLYKFPANLIAAFVNEVAFKRHRPWTRNVGTIRGRPDRGYTIQVNPDLSLAEVRRVVAHEMGHIWAEVFRVGDQGARFLTGFDLDYAWDARPPERIEVRFPEALLREWSYNRHWRLEGLARLIRTGVLQPEVLQRRGDDAWLAFVDLWIDTTDEDPPTLPDLTEPPPPEEPPMPRRFNLNLLASLSQMIRIGRIMRRGYDQGPETIPNVAALLRAPDDSRAAIVANFPVLQWGNAAAVAERESEFIHTAHKDDAIEDSRGDFQINVRAHPWAVSLDLFDADVNAQAARLVYDAALKRHGNGWQPWSAATLLGITTKG